MKVNGTQGDYLPVSQGLQSDEDDTHLGRKTGKEEAPLKNGLSESIMASKDVEDPKSIEKSDKAPMSPLRKVCFVLSLLQCALFIIAFGWLIPCKLPRYLENPAKNWEYPLSNYDVATSFGFAKLEKKSGAILFGYQSPTNASVFGFVALNALSGNKMWDISLPASPSSLSCGQEFTAGNGPVSCLAVDKSGKMANIRAADGHIQWFVHSHNKTWTSSQLSVPSVGADCDNDTINDIFIAGYDSSPMLYIVSGSNGQLLNTIPLTICVSVPRKIIPSWYFEDQSQILFSCQDNTGFENVWSVPLKNVCYAASTSTVNADSESDSLDFGLIHSLEKGNNLIDILSVPANHSKTDFNQILITSNGHIIQLNNANATSWSFELPADLLIIEATSGRFLNETTKCIAILAKDSINPNITKVIILDENDGSSLVNYTFVNQTATSLYSMSKGENMKDSLLVRTLSPSIQDVDSVDEQDHLDSTAKIPFHFVSVEEKFLLLECSSNVSFDIPLLIPIATKCGDNGCKPDLYNTVPTVLLADVDGDGNSELIQTIFVLSNNLDAQDISSNIKLSRLRTVPSSCGSCGCS